jgi:hypothetical protein
MQIRKLLFPINQRFGLNEFGSCGNIGGNAQFSSGFAGLNKRFQ